MSKPVTSKVGAASKNKNKKVRLSALPLRKSKPSQSPPKNNLEEARHKSKGDSSRKGISNVDKAKGKEPAKRLQREIFDHGATQRDKLALPKTFRIIAGTYEKLLYGLEISFKQSDTAPSESHEPQNHQLQLKTLFIFPAHVACIKTAAASPFGGKWLATGSADEIIKVWDLRRLKEVGGLMHHTGSITHLTFPSRSHLMSASEDGTLCLFHTRDWEVLRSMKGHKGRINHVAVHPSSKIALSVGKDKTLRMWDLMRGKGAASTKLGKEAETVCWSTSGTRFAVQSGSNVDIHSLKMAVLCSITHSSRIHDVKFFHPNFQDMEYLIVAGEDKKVTVYELPVNIEESNQQPKIVGELVGHQNRVKSVDFITIQAPPSNDKLHPNQSTRTYATTISSDGFIRIYDLYRLTEIAAKSNSTDERVILESIIHFDTSGSRLTCLTLASGEMAVPDVKTNGKRKREERDSDVDSIADGVGFGIDGDIESEEEEDEVEEEEEE